MTSKTKVCLVGQVLVDVTFPGDAEEPKLRFGGLAHAARTLWAMDAPYVLAYFAPEYLSEQISRLATEYGRASAHKIGNVLGCPNVVTIGEPTEAGPQGYQFLLRDEQKMVIDSDALARVCRDEDIADFIIFPGGCDLAGVLRVIGPTRSTVHIDANFQPDDPSEFAVLGRRFATIMMSTSSEIFKGRYGGQVANLRAGLLSSYADAILFKENRGGSRFFSSQHGDSPIRIAAQSRHVRHSVGVGDCFDAAYVVNRHEMAAETALAYAACIAAEYACTTYPDDFRDAVRATMKISQEEIVQLSGVSLPWEHRPECNIYIAAPDFSHLDRRPIEKLVKCLKYHNFTPRRPVVEHGEMGENAGPQRKQALCDSDVRLMAECRLMVAVLLYEDPGTLIEIGMAVERRMPVIVYDPYRRAENLILTQLPDFVSPDLDEVISAVFKHAAKRMAS